MTAQTIGPLLRELRLQAGRSQKQQADLLSELALRAVTRNEVSRWEAEGRLLTPFWQRHYAESFEIPAERLRGAVEATKAQNRSRRVANEDGVAPVQRREFIGVLAGLAVPQASLDLPRGRRIGKADLDTLYRHTTRMRRLDNFMGGADTYQAYAHELSRTGQLVQHGQYSAAIGRSLRCLIAEQEQMTGWAAFDAGEHVRAHAHYLSSLRTAEEVGDAVLAGNALAFIAYQQSGTEGAAATAAASYDKAGGAATPRVRALLLERQAWAYAVAGEQTGVDTSLAQARDALGGVGSYPEPDWVFWVDERELDIMAGRCWAELRRPLRAVPTLESALSHFDDTHARDKSLYLTWLADSYLDAREVEQSAKTLERAHALASGVSSARPVVRIKSVARRLTQHRKIQAVADVLDVVCHSHGTGFLPRMGPPRT